MSDKALLILERPWYSLSENPPQCSVIPFFQSLERLNGNIAVYYSNFFERESFRAALNHLMGHIHDSSIIYIASHGDGKYLAGNGIGQNLRLETALWQVFSAAANSRRVEGLLLGSCFLGQNEDLITGLFEGSGLRWIVAYTASVEWLASSLIDMQIVSHLSNAKLKDLSSIEAMTSLFAAALRLFNPYTEMATDNDERPVELKDAIRIWVRRAGQGNHAVYDITEDVANEAWEFEAIED